MDRWKGVSGKICRRLSTEYYCHRQEEYAKCPIRFDFYIRSIIIRMYRRIGEYIRHSHEYHFLYTNANGHSRSSSDTYPFCSDYTVQFEHTNSAVKLHTRLEY